MSQQMTQVMSRLKKQILIRKPRHTPARKETLVSWTSYNTHGCTGMYKQSVGLHIVMGCL